MPHCSASHAYEAEVLYYTSNKLVRAVQNKFILRKPIIMKEISMDSGTHTLANTASLLNDKFTDAEADIRELDNTEPTRMLVSEFVAGIEFKCLDSVQALNLGSITQCRRPFFTMLPRYHLLNSVPGRIERNDLDGHANQSPVGASGCVGFSRLELARALP